MYLKNVWENHSGSPTQKPWCLGLPLTVQLKASRCQSRDLCSITSETPPKWTVKMMNLEGSGFIILYSPNLLLEKFQEANSISLDNSEEKGTERENFHAQMTMLGTITLCCVMRYGEPTWMVQNGANQYRESAAKWLMLENAMKAWITSLIPETIQHNKSKLKRESFSNCSE